MTTAGAALDAALAHLRAADPVLARLIDEQGPPERWSEGSRPAPDEHYGALVRSIVGQQLSVTAARSIYGRLVAFFGGHTPSPQEVLDADPDEMRLAAGLSQAKTRSLRSLADHVISGDLELERLNDLPDDEVVARLVAVKGIGEWSASVFLMFHLGRPDVVAAGDLGIRRAVQRAYGRDEIPTAAEVTALAESWRPYRTTACLILWHSLRNAPAVAPDAT